MRQLSFKKSIAMLKKYGINIVQHELITSQASIKKLKHIQFPCVLKMYAAEVIHKKKAGTVVLNITGQAQFAAEYNRMKEFAKKNRIARHELVAQRQVSGFEVIVGGKQDLTFGPVVLLGLGGIYAEVLKRTALRICPISNTMAQEMVDEIVPLDKKNEIAAIIGKIAKLIAKEKIQELDLNPIILNENGCHIVDVRIMV